MSTSSNTTSALTRRAFLASAAAAAAMPLIAPYLGLGASPAHAATAELPFGSALAAADAIRSKSISSVELTQIILDRIAAHNPKINAVVTVTAESALARAKEADAATAKGESWDAFHGVPIDIKDTFELEGVRTTAGAAFLSDYVGKYDAVGVARLKSAGAVITGKSNVPFLAGDVQTYNDVFGQTNNPWNVERTSGGSTGGGAAALAAGLTFLSFGSDIGGSIRTPSNFCGVFGHKPTLDLVPERGHIPPMPGGPSITNNLSVAGPLARSGEDLMAAMKVLGGPADEYATAYRWEMPAPRQSNLKDYRVGYVLDDPFCPVSPETKAVLEKALKAAEKAGCKLVEGWPEGIDPNAQMDAYTYILFAILDSAAPPDLVQHIKELAAAGDPTSVIRQRAFEDPSRALGMQLGVQKASRMKWQAYFQGVDVFLSPVTFIPAFPHDHSDQAARRLTTSLGDRSYMDILGWICHATYNGLPATSMPAGLTADNLPVGLQIAGAFLEDATPIDFATRLSKEIGGYTPPPGFT